MYASPVSPSQEWQGCGLEGTDLFDFEDLLDTCFGEAQPGLADSRLVAQLHILTANLRLLAS